MLRRALLWASTNQALAERVPSLPFMRRATRRFMPGERLEDALGAAEQLARAGCRATLTLLGERLEGVHEADEVAEHYLDVLARIRELGLEAEISVKLTQLGLDYGPDVATERLMRLAESTESLVWVDMERSEYAADTIDLFRRVHAVRPNVGLCLQSYLRRTESDLEGLLPAGPAIRLVKGAYREPETVAYPRKRDVDSSFLRLATLLLQARAAGGKGRPVIATHDPRMLAETARLARRLGLDRGTYEYGLLYGIAEGERRRLIAGGEQVRVLISYGSAWFPWYMRRLAERPANLWFVAKQLVG